MWIAVSLYMSYQKTTSETIKHQLKMTFPAVTICNNNAVMVNKLMSNEELKEMVYGTSATSSSDNSNNNSSTANSTSADGKLIIILFLRFVCFTSVIMSRPP